jgi:riboflavin synthase
MFTGIVSHVGRVVGWRPDRLGVQQPELAAQLEPGASVAVNGVCLTVTEVDGATFFADVVPETQRRTNLGALGPGNEVNLELPLRMQQGLDGHLVQGHVDGTTTVGAVRDVDLGREATFELPRGLAGYIAEKGSVALDGTSLTVAGLDERAGTFTVALIPHTLEHTVARLYAPGRLVNVEVDVVARYVERLMRNAAPVAATSGAE